MFNIFHIQKHQPNSTFLNAKGVDASNFVEDYINDNRKKIKAGFYLIKRPIILSEVNQQDLRNVVFYTINNHKVLIIKSKRHHIENLEINSKLVNKPTANIPLIEIVHDELNQHSKLLNVRLIGRLHDDLENLINEGHTGIMESGKSEFHFSENKIFVSGLNNGIYFRDLKNDTTMSHEINIVGSHVKKLAYIGANDINLKYVYNNAYTLLEDEKDNDLVSLKGDFCTYKTKFIDANKGKKLRTRLSQIQGAHKYKLTDYNKHNISLDNDYDWGEVKEKWQ